MAITVVLSCFLFPALEGRFNLGSRDVRDQVSLKTVEDGVPSSLKEGEKFGRGGESDDEIIGKHMDIQVTKITEVAVGKQKFDITWNHSVKVKGFLGLRFSRHRELLITASNQLIFAEVKDGFIPQNLIKCSDIAAVGRKTTKDGEKRIVISMRGPQVTHTFRSDKLDDVRKFINRVSRCQTLGIAAAAPAASGEPAVRAYESTAADEIEAIERQDEDEAADDLLKAANRGDRWKKVALGGGQIWLGLTGSSGGAEQRS